MRPKEEAQQAWVLWQMLTDMSDRLWQVYQSEFLDFSALEADPEGLTGDEDP